MTNETPNPEAQPVSQKYAAMNKFTNARNNDVVYAPHWETLQAVKIELIADPEERRQACHTAYNSMSGHDVFVRACPLAPRPGVLESSRALEISEVITIVDRITMTMLGPDPDLPILCTSMVCVTPMVASCSCPTSMLLLPVW